MFVQYNGYRVSFLEVIVPGLGIDTHLFLGPKLKKLLKYNASGQRPIERPIEWVPVIILGGQCRDLALTTHLF